MKKRESFIIHQKTSRYISAFRIVLISIFLLFIFSFYSYSLFKIQVKNSNEYVKKSENIMQQTYIVEPKRGEIYDASGLPLAINRKDYFNLYLTPKDIKKENLKSELEEINSIIEIPVDDLIKEIKESKDYQIYYKKVLLSSTITEKRLFAILERSDRLKGISFSTNTLREYPQNELFSHIVGSVGKIQDNEIRYLYNQGYKEDSIIGKNGIEKEYEYLLKGHYGKYYKQVNAKGKSVDEESSYKEIERSQNGYKLVLNLKKDYQELLKKTLGKRSSSAIILKPSTGQVLGMYSYPDYNPNILYKSKDTKKINELFSQENSPLINRAIQSLSPPASTFKILMGLAMLNEKAFSKNRTVLDTGSLKIGNRVFHNYQHEVHGYVDLEDALRYSDNVYFYTIGTRYLGVDTISSYAKKLGFGKPSGIDLPGEKTGTVPSKNWKEKTLRTPWFLGDTANMSIGQGYLTVNPMQMANLVALFVNEGVVYKPKVLSEIRNYDDFSLQSKVSPEVLYKFDAPKAYFREIKKDMRTVISKGSTNAIFTPKMAVKIAGKTGTGESSYGEDNKYSWFVSFGPYDKPKEDQIVVVVWIDAKNEWDWWAPKAASIIYQGIYTGQNYEDSVVSLMPSWYLPDKKTYQKSQKIIKEKSRKKYASYYSPAPKVNDETSDVVESVDIEEELKKQYKEKQKEADAQKSDENQNSNTSQT